jgi:hypothetical protein
VGCTAAAAAATPRPPLRATPPATCSLIQSRTLINYVNGPLDLGAAEDPVLASHVEEVQLTDAGDLNPAHLQPPGVL